MDERLTLVAELTVSAIPTCASRGGAVGKITGKDSAAETFRKDASIDACFAISPDMQSLTGGLDKKGTGAEGTVKDAAVLVSTATMKRSIADVYACRKDFYDANKPLVEKFAAGYVKGCEELLDVKAKVTIAPKVTISPCAKLEMPVVP